MSVDLKKTLTVTKGGLLDAQNTWKTYLEDSPAWQQTALILSGPLIIANVLLSTIFSRMTGGYAVYGYQSGWFMSLILGLVMAAIGLLITVFVFNFLAGVFSGTANFDRAFAAVSLAAIPAWLAGAVGGLIPFLGFLLILAGGILSLVYLYRIIPLALNVPQNKRVLHYVASLLLIIVINMVIGSILGIGGGFNDSDYSPVGDSGGSSGMMGEIARQTDLMTAASADKYDPPAEGDLDEGQVETYISVMQKTRSIQAQYQEKMQKMSADREAKDTSGEGFSLSDFRQAYSGAGAVLGASNAEMEVVKSGGGNWAEHEWVKQQLRTARYQQGEGSDANAHNYTLYQKYEEDLKEG